MKLSDKTDLIDDVGIVQPQLAQKALEEAAKSSKKTRPHATDKFSKTAIKKLLNMTKNQLVDMVIQMSNYAEQQKMSNIVLSNALQELKKQKVAELEKAAAETAIVPEDTK